MNFPLLSNLEWISPRPILFVTGEHAHSRYYSEDAYERAAEPKELYIVPNAGHVDLYDKTDLIPFDKLDEFFTEHLSPASSDAARELFRLQVLIRRAGGCTATRWTPAGYPRRWAAPARPTICGSGTSPRNGWPPATMPRREPQAATGTTSGAPNRPRRSATSSSKTSCWTRWLASPPPR